MAYYSQRVDIYGYLDYEIEKQATKLGLLGSTDNQFVKNFLWEHIKSGNYRDQEISTYTLSFESKGSFKTSSKRKPKRKIKASQRRRLHLYDLDPSETKYHLYEPLHQLWLQQMRTLLDNHRQNTNMDQMYTTLMKADYHGCIMTVTRSKCPTYVGITGILLQETRNVFKFITKENQLKTIPKQNSIFTFELDDKVYTIYGNHFRVRTRDRASKKFKAKSTIDL